jgi:hypothetical protein
MGFEQRQCVFEGHAEPQGGLRVRDCKAAAELSQWECHSLCWRLVKCYTSSARARTCLTLDLEALRKDHAEATPKSLSAKYLFRAAPQGQLFSLQASTDASVLSRILPSSYPILLILSDVLTTGSICALLRVISTVDWSSSSAALIRGLQSIRFFDSTFFC